MGKTYLTRHRHSGWRYRRAVPRALIRVVGKAEWNKHLGQLPNKAAAEAKARVEAVRHDDLIARLRALTPAERTALIRQGGLAHGEAFVAGTDHGLVFLDHLAGKTLRADDPARAESALAIMEAKSDADQMRAEAAPLRAALEKADAAAGSGNLQPLIDLWTENRPSLAASSVAKTKLYVQRFIEAVGDLEPRRVTRKHALQFRDDLEKRNGITLETGNKHLHALHRLFAVGMNEGIVDSNPFHKITVRRAAKASAASKKPFEIEHVRLIFAALADMRPSKYRGDFRLIVRMVAYHGMRSGEAAHLRCADVTMSMGIPILRLTEEAGSKKNEQSVRDVPIHPAMLQEITHRAQALGDGWLFPSFPNWKGKRGSWFQRNGGTFLRKIGITDPALTMHSFRHLWRTLARELDMPQDVSRSIMGHELGRDDHAEYGGGPSLKGRAEWMAKIDPLD